MTLVKILVTAGPTREPIDPVRFIGNRSSGRMGYALARAFRQLDHQVLLISGPTHLDVPDGVDFIPVETAEEMDHAVSRSIGRVEVGVFCAAVADYAVTEIAPQKIKKNQEILHLTLKKTKDILGSVRPLHGFCGYLVGFAAETENVEQHAREKLLRKGCDMIIANDVSQPGIGFDSSDNELLVVEALENTVMKRDSKEHLARHLASMITERALRKMAS